MAAVQAAEEQAARLLPVVRESMRVWAELLVEAARRAVPARL